MTGEGEVVGVNKHKTAKYVNVGDNKYLILLYRGNEVIPIGTVREKVYTIADWITPKRRDAIFATRGERRKMIVDKCMNVCQTRWELQKHREREIEWWKNLLSSLRKKST